MNEKVIKEIVNSLELPTRIIEKELGKCENHGEPLKYWNLEKGKEACHICKLRDSILSSIETKSAGKRQLLEQANIPLRFKDKTFSNYMATTLDQKENIRVLKRFINQPGNVGLLMIGSNGTGKTHLAVAILKEMITKADFPSVFTEAIKIIRSIKDSWILKHTTEFEIIEMYTNPYLLIIDEVGVQFGSETERQYLTEVINDRYNAMKPTILMGNVNIRDLAKLLGDRIIDRYKEDGKVLTFDWQSYRGSQG